MAPFGPPYRPPVSWPNESSLNIYVQSEEPRIAPVLEISQQDIGFELVDVPQTVYLTSDAMDEDHADTDR